MNTAKVLEVLGKHIIKLEEELQYKDIQIDNLKNKIKRLEGMEYEKIKN